jgi:hypothetical protein
MREGQIDGSSCLFTLLVVVGYELKREREGEQTQQG